MDTTLNLKQTDPQHVLVTRTDEEPAHAYEQITRADEQIARADEQLSIPLSPVEGVDGFYCHPPG